MLMEHSFVTTRECRTAMDQAGAFLRGLGFQTEEPDGGTLEARRGRNDPAKAKTIAELPQRVRVEFDRGRVLVAAAIQEHRQAGPLHANLLLALADGLEKLLAANAPEAEALIQWRESEAAIESDLRRRRRKNRVTACVLLGICLLPIVILIWMNS